MKPLIVVSAAALLALGAASTAQANPAFYLSGLAPLAQKIACWDECEEMLEALAEAREEAREAAEEYAEEARAEYEEELEAYGYAPRRTLRPARTTPQVKKPAIKPASEASNDTKAPTKTKDVAVNAPPSCKQYSPATGMLLSVPCE